MRFFSGLMIASILVSCGGNKEEVLDLDDIVTKADYDTRPKADSLQQQTVFVPSIAAAELESAQIKWDSVLTNEELTVPERFSPIAIEKFTYWTNSKPVEYSRWSFPDSSRTMKAFLNWMNCYGEKCLMIELRKNMNIQRNALLILQNDTSIVHIQSASLGLTELKKWKKMYFAPKGAKWNYVVTQPKGGKATWSKFGDEEETEFIQLETE